MRRFHTLDREALFMGLAIAVLSVLVVLSGSEFWMNLLSLALIMGLLAASVDLLFGYTGLLTFGQAGLFGLSAYAFAILTVKFHLPVAVSAAGALAATVVTALLIGYVCSRLKEIQFAIVTLAFGQLFWTMAVKLRFLTNGDDGLSVPRYKLLGDGFLLSAEGNLLLIALVVFGSYYLLRRVVRSPFGYLLRGVKERESRIPFMGYSVTYIKTAAYGLSGLFAGIAGVLYVLLRGFVSPNLPYWTTSGDALVMALLGGIGTLYGPFIGSGLYLLIEDTLSSYTQNWMLGVGLLFILVVIYAPQGLVGLFGRLRRMAGTTGRAAAITTSSVEGDSE